MWNPAPQGLTPAEATAGFHVGGNGGISPSLLQQPHPLNDAVQAAIQSITAILKQRQKDQIANQLLAIDNAPKATAVDGTQPDQTKYAPDSQLTQAMVAQNLAGGYPAAPSQAPDLGGVNALVTQDLIKKHLQSNEKADLDAQLTRARIERTLHPVMRATAAPRDPNAGKVWSDEAGGFVSPEAILRHQDATSRNTRLDDTYGSGPERKRNLAIENFDANLQSRYGFGVDDVAGASNQRITDAQGNQIDPLGEDGKPVPGAMFTFTGADGQSHSIPADEAKQAISRVNKLGGVNALAAYSQRQKGATEDAAPAPAAAPAKAPPQGAIDYLKAHPELAPDFDAKYGPGAAQRYF